MNWYGPTILLCCAVCTLTLIQLWVLYNKLPTPTSGSARKVQSLKKEIVQLKRELGNTSPQDNFSKWAKLDRQHNKAMAEYQKLGTYISGHWSILFSLKSSATNKIVYRRFSTHAPSHVYIRSLDASLDRHSRSPYDPAVLVCQIAHVLVTSWLGSILR